MTLRATVCLGQSHSVSCIKWDPRSKRWPRKPDILATHDAARGGAGFDALCVEVMGDEVLLPLRLAQRPDMGCGPGLAFAWIALVGHARARGSSLHAPLVVLGAASGSAA